MTMTPTIARMMTMPARATRADQGSSVHQTWDLVMGLLREKANCPSSEKAALSDRRCDRPVTTAVSYTHLTLPTSSTV